MFTADGIAILNQRVGQHLLPTQQCRSESRTGLASRPVYGHQFWRAAARARGAPSCLRPRAGVVDLDCGAGVPATRLLIDAGFVVTRVDISEVQIERARSLVPDATFICADTCPALTPKRPHVLETRLKRYHQFSGTRSGRLPGRRA